MPRTLSPIKRLPSVSKSIEAGAVQARKLLVTGCPYTKLKTGQVFDIFLFEPTNGADGDWICVCRDMADHWYLIPENYFDWERPSFEIDLKQANEIRRKVAKRNGESDLSEMRTNV